MKYWVDGLLVPSENAAKPPERASKFVTDWISRQPQQEIAMDYGCGKLRYANALHTRFSQVHFVDSYDQLHRRQVISRKQTTVVDEVRRHYPNGVVHTLESETWKGVRANLVLCTNVLSAIPFVDARLGALENIADVLKPNGQLFLCVQYRNSHYKAWEASDKVKRYGDGFLIPKGKIASFYACLPLETLIEYIKMVGLRIAECLTAEQKAIVIAKP